MPILNDLQTGAAQSKNIRGTEDNFWGNRPTAISTRISTVPGSLWRTAKCRKTIEKSGIRDNFALFTRTLPRNESGPVHGALQIVRGPRSRRTGSQRIALNGAKTP